MTDTVLYIRAKLMNKIVPLLLAARNFQLPPGKSHEGTDISNISSDATFRQVRLTQRFSFLNAY